ncbi:MAG: LysR family transcriptional regulator [Pseudolabrys sp.]
MNTHDLEAFITVVETGSIVGAAAKLNVTQPAVTRRIQNLEAQLGTALLDRQSKPLKPTQEGRDAYEHGRRVLRSFEDLRAGVAADGVVGGEFRLGIMCYLSEAALTQPLDRLRAEFPQLCLRITSDWSPRLLEQASRSELDAAAISIAEGHSPPEDLVGEDLGPQTVLIVAARSLGVPKRASAHDLSRFPWVLNQNGCGYRTLIRRTFEAAGLPFQVGVEALSGELRSSLVARGLGIGIISPAAFAESPWRDQLDIIDAPDFSLKVRSWLVYRPPAGRLARPIAAFKDALIKTIAQSESVKV